MKSNNILDLFPAECGFDKDTGRLFTMLYMPLEGKDYYVYASCDEIDVQTNNIIDFSLEFYDAVDSVIPLDMKYDKQMFDELEATCYDLFYSTVDEMILDKRMYQWK